jgi:hypothetical protein
MFCAQRRRLFWGPLVAFCFGPCFCGAFRGLDLVAALEVEDLFTGGAGAGGAGEALDLADWLGQEFAS